MQHAAVHIRKRQSGASMGAGPERRGWAACRSWTAAALSASLLLLSYAWRRAFRPSGSSAAGGKAWRQERVSRVQGWLRQRREGCRGARRG